MIIAVVVLAVLLFGCIGSSRFLDKAPWRKGAEEVPSLARCLSHFE